MRDVPQRMSLWLPQHWDLEVCFLLCLVRALRKEEALLDRFALPDNFQPVIAVAFGYKQADPISRRKSLVSYKCNKASKEEDCNAMH